MTHDRTDAPAKRARTRQAKGSVQEAIGKITGDVLVEHHGRQESRAGAQEAKAQHPDTETGKD